MKTDPERCFKMLRRFVSDFDDGAYEWLVHHDAVVEEFLLRHLDRLTASERVKLYVILYGAFRKCYKRVMEVRLQLETDPKCREVLAEVEEKYRVAIDQPYSPVTDAGLLAGCEGFLQTGDSGLRYVGALGIWTLSKDSTRIAPVLRAILQDRDATTRKEAAELLGEVSPVDEETIQALQAVANDAGDPVRFAAQESLSECQRQRC